MSLVGVYSVTVRYIVSKDGHNNLSTSLCTLKIQLFYVFHKVLECIPLPIEYRLKFELLWQV